MALMYQSQVQKGLHVLVGQTIESHSANSTNPHDVSGTQQAKRVTY
jgi:hypothetical protein